MNKLPFAILVVLPAFAHAGSPVSIELPEAVAVRRPLVTIGDVAQITGGTEAERAEIARLDLEEITGRTRTRTIGRDAVAYRIRLAGFSTREFRVSGAERVGIVPAKRALTAGEIEKAVRDELVRQLPAGEPLTVQLARAIAVQLPEVAVWEPVRIQGRPHTPIRGPGPLQMDVTISTNGETLLGLALHFEIRRDAPIVKAPPPVAAPIVQAKAEILVKARQRVTMVVASGALKITAIGEAAQDGRLGDIISLTNVDSKKTLTGKVTGPGTVEIELGGSE